MSALTTAVAVAAACLVLFMVSAVVGTLVWVKARQERRALAAAGAGQGRYACFSQAFEADATTSLSREEGSVLRLYGQLPYGRPTEWDLLTSRESLAHSMLGSGVFSLFTEKARSLRRSLPRTLSARQLRGLLRPRPSSSLAPLPEAAERLSRPNERVSVSAVEGVVELPTETTPRQTPEREEERTNVQPSIQPILGQMPLIRTRTGNLLPVLETEGHRSGIEQPCTRIRGGSITNQTAGVMPQHPAPPPPSYPPSCFRLSKNDSMWFSSVSLETADSSILDGGRTSTGIESDFTSPALPPCPTFAPFSANDVGRTEFERRSFAAPSIFPTASLDGLRPEARRTSPHRSLTTRSPNQASRVSRPPRRSESFCASQSRRDVASMPDLDPKMTPQLSATGHSCSLLSHFNQMQRHSMYAARHGGEDPFYDGMTGSNGSIKIPHAPGRRASSPYASETPGNAPKPSLASAAKNGNGHWKGHRRQNCVRISIHPISPGWPVFSPMAEEPGKLDDLDMRRTEVPSLASFHFHTIEPSIPTSTSEHNSCDSKKARLRVSGVSSTPYGSPTKKRKHSRTDSNDDFLSPAGSDKALPESDGVLSQTPSPEKVTVWTLPTHTSSPTTHEYTSPIQSSRRRSAVKGPRSQPGKIAHNNVRLAAALEENNPASVQSGTLDGCPHQKAHPSRDGEIDPGTQDRAEDWRGSSSQQPQPDLHKTPSTRSGNMVTIWEDNDTEQRTMTSPVKHSASPRKVGRKMSRKSSQRTCRQITTPTRKIIGLGIGAATPGSLYDGDGFLKE